MTQHPNSTFAAAILVLVEEIRSRTLQLLAAAPEDALLWAPPGTSNHILWHAGHCLWLADVLCIKPIRGQSELKDGWTEMFGGNGRSPSVIQEWPSRDELTHLLAEQQERVKELVSQLADADLDRVVSARSGATLARWIIHGLHDEAMHQGEMYLLMKLRKIGRG
jgi:hypothetical protein